MDKFFTYPFRYTPSEKVVAASRELISRIDADDALHEFFAEGKMMGVLVCEETVLYGFSGLAGGRALVDGFVPPIFDYTAPDGYFRRQEALISQLADRGRHPLAEGFGLRPQPLPSKLGPLPLHLSGGGQTFCKGVPVTAAQMSRELQDWLFRQYVVMNGRGEQRSILDIFADRGLVPPGGTGECAAPKLLNYAFRHGLHPLEMGEFWYGASSSGQVREQGHFYPSCTGKCGPLLTWMMQGLNVAPNPLDAPFLSSEPRVLFSDDAIIAVCKPSGMLSVPGKTAAPCLMDWLSERFGQVYSCHRLDQDTSGVMVYARTLDAKVELERQFAARETKKTYRARLMAAGEPFAHARRGTIALPLMLDYYERPCQMVDAAEGKKAVTKYEVLDIFPDGEIDVRFYPQTGRTHQLRVHAAHPDGLGRPIKGDHLYGGADGGRLYLHAERLEFRHPVSGEAMTFVSDMSDGD